MASAQPSPPRFLAHAKSDPRHSQHLVPGAESFEDAALRFAEHWSPSDNDSEVAIIVTECGSGEQQCFVIDLDAGDASPCS